jgi:hypothetical protein
MISGRPTASRPVAAGRTLQGRQVLLYDTFTDTSGVDINAHTPDINVPGSAYVIEQIQPAGGTPAANATEIQSNQLEFDTTFCGYTYDTGVTDYVLEFDWVISSTSGHRLGIFIRWADFNNNYFWNLREPNDDWNFYRYTAGAQSTIGSGAFTFNTSTTYKIRIETSGTSSTLYINGVLISTQVANQHTTATKIAPTVQTITTPVTLDNMIVSAAPASGTNTPVTGTFSGVGTNDLTIGVNLGNKAFTGIGTANLDLTVGKPFSYSGVGTLGLTKDVGINRAFTGIGTLAMTKVLVAGRVLVYTGIGTSDLTLAVGINRAFTGVGTNDLTLDVGINRAFTAIGTVTLGTVFTPGGANFPVSGTFTGIGTVTLLTQFNPGAVNNGLADPSTARARARELRRQHVEEYARRYDVQAPRPSSVRANDAARAQAELRRTQLSIQSMQRDLDQLRADQVELDAYALELRTNQAMLDAQGLELSAFTRALDEHSQANRETIRLEQERAELTAAIAMVARAVQRARNTQIAIQSIIHLFF